MGIVAAAGALRELEGVSPISLIVLGAYVLSPWAVLALGAGSLGNRARALALGVIAALTVVTYVSVATSGSSTEALAFVFVPIYQWMAVGAIWLISSIGGAEHG